MKAKDLAIMAAAALGVFLLLRGAGRTTSPEYWVVSQGNTGYPDAARTGGGVWI